MTIYLGIAAIITAFLLNFYMFLWSLKGWGLLDLPPWLNDFVFMLDTEGGESVIFMTEIEGLLDFVKELVMDD